MKKVILGISFLLTAAVIFAFGGKEADAKSPLAGTTLNLYTWAGMFPREVLSGFEKETGCRINYANFDTDEAMLAKLQETGGAGYDFVIADDYILEMVYKQGLAQDLDKEQIPNYENINPVFQGQFFDPDNVFTIPHGAGIPLIAYDPSLTEISIEGYADLWNPALNQNVAVIGNYRLSFGQGLVMNTNFSLGKQSILSSIYSMNKGIKKHSSTSESNYFRGLAASVSLSKNLFFTGFYSFREQDATLDGMFITSFKTDGYHRTPLEMSKKNNINNHL